jgi:hypothetical protein
MSHGRTVSHFPFHATGLQNPLATALASVSGLATNRRKQNVARKSKNEQQKQSNADPAGLDPAARAIEGIVALKSKAKAASASSKKKKAAPKKEKAASAAKPAASKKAAASSTPGPSDEEIRIRAYFIAERRHRLSLAGDSAHDWIEAKRQLIEEAGQQS